MPSEAGIEYIVDIAVSPDYSHDNTLFMLTWGGDFKLWRIDTETTNCEMLFTSMGTDIYDIKSIGISPQYGSGAKVLYMAGSTAGGNTIWKSEDGGQSFICQNVTLPIDAWAVADDATLFVAAYNGSQGIVYKTQDGGESFSSAVICGSQPLSCLKLSPQYNRDGKVLAANSNGWVYMSEDGGSSFKPLPFGADSPPLNGVINVAFDPGFIENGTVYASSDNPDSGIYRFVIGESNLWEEIDSTLPPGAMLGGLGVSADGVLYASNFQQASMENNRGGMERCLEPAKGNVFETVTEGLDDGSTMIGMWHHDNKIWSIDTTGIKLMVFTDSLAFPVALEKPDNGKTGIGTFTDGTVEGIWLEWQMLSSAEGYRWQLDDEEDFASMEDGFEGSTKATLVELPPLEPGETYFWRVRAEEPLLSFWSETWSFTTGDEVIPDAPVPQMPEDGADGVPVSPLFSWSAISGVGGYELVVSRDEDFNETVINRFGGDILDDCVWQSDTSLLYNTPYFWRVRAVNANASSSWSSVASFTTEAEPGETIKEDGQNTKEGGAFTMVTALPLPSVKIPLPSFVTAPATQTTAPEITVDSPPPQTLIRQSQEATEWIYSLAWVAGGALALTLITALLLMKRR